MGWLLNRVCSPGELNRRPIRFRCSIGLLRESCGRRRGSGHGYDYAAQRKIESRAAELVWLTTGSPEAGVAAWAAMPRRLSFSATPASGASISLLWGSIGSDYKHRRIGGSLPPALGRDESPKPACPGR